MSSMVTLGVSFLLFFIVLGFQWMVGVHLLSELFQSLPAIKNAGWLQTGTEVEAQLKTIFLWVPPILLLFAAIKMLSNAASRGED